MNLTAVSDGASGSDRSLLLYTFSASVISFLSSVIPWNSMAIVSGDFEEYDVSRPQVNFLNFSFPATIFCFTHSAVTTCCFRLKFGNTRPVAFPLSP